MKKKIFFFSTSRSDFGLQFNVLKKFSLSNVFETTLVISGSHYSKKFGNTYMDIKKQLPNNIKTIKIKSKKIERNKFDEIFSELFLEFGKIIKRSKIDYIFLVGDRFEILSIAIHCLFRNIPLIHLHGGELTYGAIDDAVRYSISKIAKLHFVTTQNYKNRLLQTGEQKKSVIVCGSPILENINTKNILSFEVLVKEKKIKLKKPFILCTYHSESKDINNNMVNLKLLKKCLTKLKNYQIVFTYPNFDEGSQELINYLKKVNDKKKIFVFKSLGIKNYFAFMKHCDLVVGNSSSGIIEAASFKKPVLNLGLRQAGRERSKNTLDCKFDEKQIDKCLKILINKNFEKNFKNIKNVYFKKNASNIILKKCENITLNKKIKKFSNLVFNRSIKFKIIN